MYTSLCADVCILHHFTGMVKQWWMAIFCNHSDYIVAHAMKLYCLFQDISFATSILMI